MATGDEWISIKKVFRQHASLVVTIPWYMRRSLEVEKGDHLVFEWDPDEKFVKVYKWHKGVERSYPDYGGQDLRHKKGTKPSKRGGK